MHLVRKGGLMLAESAARTSFLEENAWREEPQGLDVALLGRAELDGIASWISPQVVRADALVGNVARAERLAPAIGALRVIRTWAGMNTTADSSSIICRPPGAERVVMAAPEDVGCTLAPLVAQMAASVVTGRDPPADPTPCSPARFAA